MLSSEPDPPRSGREIREAPGGPEAPAGDQAGAVRVLGLLRTAAGVESMQCSLCRKYKRCRDRWTLSTQDKGEVKERKQR